MRRLTVLLLLALPALLLAACGGGDDQSAEIEQLQLDVQVLQAQVDVLTRELEIAQSAREDLEEDLEALEDANVDLAAEAAAAVAAAEAAAAPEAMRAFFRQAEQMGQAYRARVDELGRNFHAALESGDLTAAQETFRDLMGVKPEVVDASAAIEPPAALAAVHRAFVAAQQEAAVLWGDYARTAAAATTLEEFVRLVEAIAGDPEYWSSLARPAEACRRLQDAATESGIDADLRCDAL